MSFFSVVVFLGNSTDRHLLLSWMIGGHGCALMVLTTGDVTGYSDSAISSTALERTDSLCF